MSELSILNDKRNCSLLVSLLPNLYAEFSSNNFTRINRKLLARFLSFSHSFSTAYVLLTVAAICAVIIISINLEHKRACRIPVPVYCETIQQ